MIEIAGLRKHFGATLALDGLDLSVRRGELLAVLGPSGCGKTTLLRAIAGYDAPGQGSIRLDGRDISALPPEKRDIGMVFQNYALFPHMTVLGNVEFGLKMRRVEKDEMHARAAAMLELVNLPGVENRKPMTLSGGQQQRVALARALAISPAVLLLDEPLANLDRNLRLQMREELRALQRRLSITTIFVTHDQEEALSVADRIAVMERGRVHQCGSPIEICVRPANQFVVDFFGLSL